MDGKQVEGYLERIGLAKAPACDAEGLAELQRAHLASVPFENLDIAEGRLPLALDEASLYDKVVNRRRGGICYELNLLFADLLRALGFEVALKGGRHPKYGDDMDHLFLLVDAPGCDVPLIADVGFAYNFAVPLRLAIDVEQDDGRDRYRICAADDMQEGYLRILRKAGLAGAGEESELYAFGPAERVREDCRQRCDWYCTSPESRFTQGPLVCIDAPGCRRTLSAHHLVTTAGAKRTVEDIETPEQFQACLQIMLGQ